MKPVQLSLFETEDQESNMNDLFDDYVEGPELTFDNYEDEATATAVYPGDIIYPALALVGEAGEVADKVAKLVRDTEVNLDDFHFSLFTRDQRRELAKELGDVLWNITMLSVDLGFTLEEIARMNLEKLQSRAERGTIRGSGDNR